MHSRSLILANSVASVFGAVGNPHHLVQNIARPHPVVRALPKVIGLEKRQSSPYLNDDSKKFLVNGSGIPEINFDVGESYAGSLSIDNDTNNPNQLFFWFFPSDNVNATDEITIWLNGGPGCSSLAGFFQENGPVLWQDGTYEPQPNPFSWTNLTNMVWIDQPIGTGYSPAAERAPANITNEIAVAQNFAGFWKNFLDTFNMTGRKVYVTGESYAGQYIPYMAQYMLQQNDTDYFNVQGVQLNNPSIGDNNVLVYAPAVQHLNNYLSVFALNNTFLQAAYQLNEECGYDSFMAEALTFPPTGKLAQPNSTDECLFWQEIVAAAVEVNPCFDPYHLTNYCPFLWTSMGSTSLAIGPNNYFNRTDVKEALHVNVNTNYTFCGNPSLGLNTNDTSQPSSYEALPYVIEQTNNVIVASGNLDYLLKTNGTLAVLNNMTWNDAQGFSSYPSDPFFVPYNNELNLIIYEDIAQPIPAIPVGPVGGGGIMGVAHTERGLTWVTVDLAGHQIPQYAPTAAYRQLEFLLGRIRNLSEVSESFTTQAGDYLGGPLGPASNDSAAAQP